MPHTEPEKIAAIATARFASIACAKGMTKGTMMADTPQALARANVMRVDTRNTTKGSAWPALLMMYSDIPRFSQAALKRNAMTSSANTEIIVENPSHTVSTNSDIDISFRAMYRIQVKTRAIMMPGSTSISK